MHIHYPCKYFWRVKQEKLSFIANSIHEINFMVISRAPHDHIAANIVFANILRCVTVPEARDNQK